MTNIYQNIHVDMFIQTQIYIGRVETLVFYSGFSAIVGNAKIREYH